MKNADSGGKYKGRWIYFDKENPNLFVPSANGIGKALNLGNTRSYLLILLVIAALIGTVVCARYAGLLADEGNYKYGLFYNNNNDPQIFVPKASGLGWTLNFANIWSYVILLPVVLIIIYSILRGMGSKK